MSYASALRGPTGSETGVTSQSPAHQEKRANPAEKAPKGKQEQKQKGAANDTTALNQQTQGAKPNQANKPPAKPSQPFAKPEGNGGGDFKALTTVFGSQDKGNKTGKDQKRRSPKPLTLRSILLRLGAPAAFLLGVTCNAFATELANINNSKENFDPHTRKPRMSLVLHYVEPPKQVSEQEENSENEDTDEKAKVKVPPTLEGEVKKLHPGDFQGARGKALIKYWQKVVEVAQYNRTSKKSLDVNLGGGLVFQDIEGSFLDTQDLSSLYRWLEATVKLLRGEKKQVIPYLNRQVTLLRVGTCGNCLIVRPDPAKPGDSIEQHIYKFDDFCESIRNVVEGFLPIVGAFVNISVGESTKVDHASNEQYLERETIIKEILQPAKLDSGYTLIKDLILKGAIPNSQLPELYRVKANARVRQQDETRSGASFFMEDVTEEDYARLTQQIKLLGDEDQRERNAAEALRKAERAEKQEEKANQNAKKRDRDAKNETEKEKKPIIKKRNVKNADGFSVEVTEHSDPKTGKVFKRISKGVDPKTSGVVFTITTIEADGTETTTIEKQKPVKPVVVKSQNQDNQNQPATTLLAANPFFATLKADTVESPSQVLTKTLEAKAQADKKAKEQKRAQEPKKAQVSAEAKQRQAREEEERRAHLKEKAEQQRKEQLAKKEAQKKAQATKQENAKAKKAITQHKKSVAFWEDENFQPLMIGLGLLLIFVAFGYAFVQQA